MENRGETKGSTIVTEQQNRGAIEQFFRAHILRLNLNWKGKQASIKVKF